MRRGCCRKASAEDKYTGEGQKQMACQNYASSHQMTGINAPRNGKHLKKYERKQQHP